LKDNVVLIMGQMYRFWRCFCRGDSTYFSLSNSLIKLRESLRWGQSTHST